jgi:hypothetical protein
MSDMVKRIVMAKAVSERWLTTNAVSEHRLIVHYIGKEGSRFPSLLRSFRDGKIKIGNVSPIPDLGVSEGFDSVTMWSTDKEALSKLAKWFETHGYETSGLW